MPSEPRAGRGICPKGQGWSLTTHPTAAGRIGDHVESNWSEVIGHGATAEEAHEESTIAKILDDRLKEEFKDDAGEDGKQYNETVLLDESKQETVVRISQGAGEEGRGARGRRGRGGSRAP